MVTFGEFMQGMDSKQIALTVVLTALVLVLLILWAVFKGKKHTETSVATRSESQNRVKSVEPEVVPRESPAAAIQMNAASSSDAVVQSGSGGQVSASTQQQVSEIPQDSVLHRHYLANEEAKERVLHEPYPSDSVLRRHYDTGHKILVETDSESVVQVQSASSTKSSSSAETVDEIPQDSVLRRHYLANQAAKELALHEPYPSDSVLKRHYDEAHKVSVVSSASDAVLEAVVAGKSCIPEDSVLKRHFVAQLRAEIEAELPPRPADSVLRRHYDTLLTFELQKRMAM